MKVPVSPGVSRLLYELAVQLPPLPHLPPRPQKGSGRRVRILPAALSGPRGSSLCEPSGVLTFYANSWPPVFSDLHTR